MGLRSSFNRSGTLANGTPVVIDTLRDADYPITVAVQPASGDSVKVEYKVGAADYQPWDEGTAGVVTAYAVDVLVSPVSAIRITRTAGSGTTSVYEVV